MTLNNMVKKNIYEDIVIGGFGLSLGATAIGALPASAAQTGVMSGLGTVGSFFPMMGTIGGASIVMKQLKNLKEVK